MEGFALNTFMGTSAGSATNLAADRDGATKATIAWDGTDGDPAAGSLKVEAPFSDYNQFVDVQKVFGATMLKNWTGLKVHVKAKVVGGNQSANNPSGVQPYVNTGATFGGYCGAYQNLKTGGGWNDYVLDLSNPACATANEVIAVGVSFQAGSGSDNDGGVNPTKPIAATIHVDSIWLEGSATCMGGTGGTGGGTAGTTGTGGGTAGTTGTGGGTAGTTGTGGGTAGTTGTGGGTAGTTGTGGGTAGTTGGGGTGGAATTTLFDFETGAAGTAGGLQGWGTTTSGASVAQSGDQHFDGTQSLKVTYGALDNANVSATVSGPALWPGTVLTFHAYLPTGFDTTGAAYVQAFSQGNNYATFDTTGNGTKTLTAGAWNTWTYTVPNLFPGGLQVLGFQLGDNANGTTVPAGSVYLDAITASGGTQNCALATPAGAHTFEMGDAGTLDTNVYKKDGSDADTVASQSTDQANGGTHSWKVAFTALPAPASGANTARRVFIDKPNIYCGQTVMVHVWLPTGSDGMTFQVFTLYNNYGKNKFTGPTTVTRNAWNTYSFTMPTDVGPGGVQQLGVQFVYTGTAAYTGNVYIDDVTW
jgi:hypothetical protein